jgi:hypothetical protein
MKLELEQFLQNIEDIICILYIMIRRKIYIIKTKRYKQKILSITQHSQKYMINNYKYKKKTTTYYATLSKFLLLLFFRS